MLAVGLTGGSARASRPWPTCWSSTGAVLIDADQVAREVVAPGGPAYQPLIDRFGTGIVDADGTIDRPALAAWPSPTTRTGWPSTPSPTRPSAST